MDFQKLDALKAKLDSYRPLPQEVVANLRQDLILRWTYHSNAIEGNTLSLKETKVVLEGLTVGGKSLREHFEAINHRQAILYAEELVAKQEALSEHVIRSLHQLVLKNIDDTNAGVYRRNNVTIAGAEHVPPDFVQVPQLMQEWLAWLKQQERSLHPVERAARVHADFVKIHPFVDGNGRTARLLMNLELLKHGFPPAVLPKERRLEYYEALDYAHTQGVYDSFFRMIEKIVVESFDPYWHALGATARHR
jgi:Fic family protein